MRMDSAKINKAIEDGVMPVAIIDIIICIILSVISFLLLLLNLFLLLTKQGNFILIIFNLILVIGAYYPILFRYKLTQYISSKSTSEKLEILKALDSNMNTSWSFWSYTISKANFYRFYYQPYWWWNVSYVVSIIYSDTGYYVNCRNTTPFWGDSNQRVSEIIESIRELESEL